jgi:branched-subunit amino acid aminotransferase/4-amino-4-deoxychorismate lyase
MVRKLAKQCEIPFIESAFSPDELSRADEAMLSSTPNCLLPVTRLNQKPIGRGVPGKIFQRLLSAWNDFVDLDIAEQARRFARR